MGYALKAISSPEDEFRVPKICSILYNAATCSITGIKRIDDRTCDVRYKFPHSTRMQRDYKVPRVSAIQIHAGLCEGFYETMGVMAAEGNLPFGITEKYVIDFASFWTLLKADVLYRSEIPPLTESIVRFEITDISIQRFRKKQCTTTMNFMGPFSGQMTELLIDLPILADI